MRIGFVGVGGMGHGMAANLLKAGHAVTVIAHRNRAPVEDLVGRGAMEAADLAGLAQASDAVVLCVPNSDVVATVVAGLRPHLDPGALIIDTGTSEPEATRALATELEAAGLLFVEAPVTGGVAQAAEGSLGALVGASPDAFARAEPILRAFCAAVHHFGPPGVANTAKLLNNFLVFTMVSAVTEVYAKAEDAGIDWAKLYDVMIRGAGDSMTLRRIIGNAIEGDFKGYVFSIDGARKDLGYFRAAAKDLGGVSPLAEAVGAVFDAAADRGLGDRMLSELLAPDVRER